MGRRQSHHLGHGQGIYPQKTGIARELGIPLEKVRYIDKWNGGTFGGAIARRRKFYPWIAHISRGPSAPSRSCCTKDQELAHAVKPQTLPNSKWARQKKAGSSACHREFHVNTGAESGRRRRRRRRRRPLRTVPARRAQLERDGFLYRTNSLLTGSSRSNSQQEFKWSWEQMMDEMAEACGMDPVKFRLLNMQKPGTKVALGQGGPTIVPMPEMENGLLTYDCYAGRSARRGSESHRMGEAQSRSRRQSRAVQARLRHGHVPAPCRTRRLSGRRGRLRLGHVQRERSRAGARQKRGADVYNA